MDGRLEVREEPEAAILGSFWPGITFGGSDWENILKLKQKSDMMLL